MIIATITDNYIKFSENTKLSKEEFEFITSKIIDFNKRNGSKIVIFKHNGHLYISDTFPVIRELYRHFKYGTIFKCTKINNNKGILESNDCKFTVVDKDNILDYVIETTRRNRK